jgi:hypothetical protein
VSSAGQSVSVCVIEWLDSENELCNLMNDSSPSMSGKCRSDLLGFSYTTATITTINTTTTTTTTTSTSSSSSSRRLRWSSG